MNVVSNSKKHMHMPTSSNVRLRAENGRTTRRLCRNIHRRRLVPWYRQPSGGARSRGSPHDAPPGRSRRTQSTPGGGLAPPAYAPQQRRRPRPCGCRPPALPQPQRQLPPQPRAPAMRRRAKRGRRASHHGATSRAQSQQSRGLPCTLRGSECEVA